MNKTEERIKYFEENSMQQLLIDLNDGGVPSETDINLINNIQKQTGLPTNVMNVLIEYVFLSCNKKLVRRYFELLAEYWTRRKLKDTKEAIDFARKEHAKYREWKMSKNTTDTEATPVEKTRINAIQSAIDNGLDNEQLGKFVRTMFNGNTTA